MDKISLSSILVTYYPNIQHLEKLLKIIQTDVQYIIIIDNTPEASHLECFDADNILLRKLGYNAGIATAQNIGITIAIDLKSTHVIFFDQDSTPHDYMIQTLLNAMQKKTSIASLGPRYIDVRQENPPPFIKAQGLRIKRQYCEEEDQIKDVDYLISSGSVIPVDTLKTVGFMQEALFIDYVDIEWGLRAKSLGFQSYGVCNAHMEHDLGNQPIKFLGNNYPLHSPLRHYYHFRNAVWMYKQQWVSVNWKIADGWRLLLKYIFYSIFAKPSQKHFIMMTKGIWHGITGKMGKLEE